MVRSSSSSRPTSGSKLPKAASWVRFFVNFSKNVTDVCFASGYQNISHFIRSFKKRYGISPSEYRIKGKSSF